MVSSAASPSEVLLVLHTILLIERIERVILSRRSLIECVWAELGIIESLSPLLRYIALILLNAFDSI